MWAILLVIAGIVLQHNPAWFAGAATVGTFCLWAGIVIFVIWLVILLVAFLAALGR